VIAKESYRKLRKASTFGIRQAAARLSPSGGTTFQTKFPPYRLVKVSRKFVQAFQRTVVSYLTVGKKTKSKKHL